MKSFYALFIARSKEFYRDKGSLAWAIVFPLMAIIGCYFAFSGNQQALFKVGVMQEQAHSEQHSATLNSNLKPVLERNYIELIYYSDRKKALQRVKQHQLDALIDPQQQNYWTNPKSSQGAVLTQLLAQQLPELSAQNLEGEAVRYVDWVLPGILGMNIMFGAIFGVGYVIVRYRKNGVLRRLKATPVSAFEFLSAQVASRLIIILLANMSIFIAAIFMLDLTMLGHYLDLFLITLLGAAAMISISLFISSRTASEELAGGLLNMVTWPMMFLSSVWFSLDDAPKWLQNIADLFPLTHLVKASRTIMLDGARLTDLYFEIGVLCLITLLFLFLGAYFFRWHQE